MDKKPIFTAKEMAAISKLIEAGELKVRLDEEGKIIPENEDVKKVHDNYPNESDSEKWRLAQAYAIFRVIKDYGLPVIRGVKIDVDRLK